LKRTHKNPLYIRLGCVLIAALTGHTRLGVTIAIYSLVAVLLLAYVSLQVMAGMLTQEIAELGNEKNVRSERLHILTAQYVSLSSRDRVVRHCERLGMTEASGGSYQRFAVSDELLRNRELMEFTGFSDPVTDAYRFSTLRLESAGSGKSDG
jgi:hypothetical protein